MTVSTQQARMKLKEADTSLPVDRKLLLHLSTACPHLLFLGLFYDPSNSPDGAVLRLPLGPKNFVFLFTSITAVELGNQIRILSTRFHP